MKPKNIRFMSQEIFNNLLKPSCMNCKFFNKVTTESSQLNDKFFQSTCKKFLVSPLQNIYYEKSGLGSVNYKERHPYAVMARMDITMCGLNGSYFIKNK